MLPKKYRLKNPAAFNATYKNRKIISDTNICVYLGKEKKDTNLTTRIAFVVSKKIHKRAVVRNRIRRLMRESLRLAIKNNQLLELNKYISVIINAKSNSVSASFQDINLSIYNLFKNSL